METCEIVARCAEHRRALADLVESLDDAQLATPSLCGKWDVRTVAAHLTVLPLVPPQKFAIELLKSRGSFHRANDAVARRLARAPLISRSDGPANGNHAAPGKGQRSRV